MASPDWLTEGFEQNRGRLRAVAYRMLGSLAEADDAVQEAWLRVARADASEVDNLSAWLTTIVARVCLNALRSRNARREEPLDTHVPDPVITRADGPDPSNPSNSSNPEDQALLADSVGLALQVVLETLTPAERLAFVLHDTFGLPFEEIAPMVGRSPAAARQLASRARRRVRGADVHSPDRDVARQREVVDAFFAAAHGGDFNALVAVLDPDVVSRIDAGAGALIPSGVTARCGNRRAPDARDRVDRRAEAPGAGERGRGRGHHTGRAAGLGHELHRLGRQDRGNQLDRRPGAPPPVRLFRPRLLNTATALSSAAARREEAGIAADRGEAGLVTPPAGPDGDGGVCGGQSQSRWLIHTDTWAGSRAWCTTPDRSSRTASRSTASFSRAAKAATVLSAS